MSNKETGPKCLPQAEPKPIQPQYGKAKPGRRESEDTRNNKENSLKWSNLCTYISKFLRYGVVNQFKLYFIKVIVIASAIVLLISISTNDWIQILEKGDPIHIKEILLSTKKNIELTSVETTKLTMPSTPISKEFKNLSSSPSVTILIQSDKKKLDITYIIYTTYGLWYWCKYDMTVNPEDAIITNWLDKNCAFIHQFIIEPEETSKSTTLSESMRTAFIFPILSILFALMATLAYLFWLRTEKDPYNVISSTLFIMSGLVLFLGMIIIISKMENEITLKRHLIIAMNDKLIEEDEQEFHLEKDDMISAIQALHFPTTFTRAGDKVYNLGWSFKLSCLSFLLLELSGILISKGLFYHIKEGLISIRSVERMKNFKCQEEINGLHSSLGLNLIFNASLEKNLCENLYLRLLESLKTPAWPDCGAQVYNDLNTDFNDLAKSLDAAQIIDVSNYQHNYNRDEVFYTMNGTNNLPYRDEVFYTMNGTNNLPFQYVSSTVHQNIPKSPTIAESPESLNALQGKTNHESTDVFDNNLNIARDNLLNLTTKFYVKSLNKTIDFKFEIQSPSTSFDVIDAKNEDRVDDIRENNLLDILEVFDLLKKKKAARQYRKEELTFKPTWSNFFKNDIPLKDLYPDI